MSKGDEWVLAIEPTGRIRSLYDDALREVFAALGRVTVSRAGHVEPVTAGGETIGWQADLSPVGGPVLGPFATRQAALDAEQTWVTQVWVAPARPQNTRERRTS